MALNIHMAGFELMVYNRSAERLVPFAELGIRAASCPAELARECGVVITCVSDSPDVEQVYLSKGGILEGAMQGLITVDCSTILPQVERKIYDKAAELGVSHLDAPVSGGVKGAKAATLAIMVGGDEIAFLKAKPILDAMGKNVTYVGSSGSGQVIKLANQTVLAGNMLGLCEGLIIAMKHGVDLDKAVEILSNGTASNWTLVNQGKQMVDCDWSAGFYSKLFKKDLSIVQTLARQTNSSLPCSALALSLYNALSNIEGGDDMGHQAVLKVFRMLSGLE